MSMIKGVAEISTCVTPALTTRGASAMFIVELLYCQYLDSAVGCWCSCGWELLKVASVQFVEDVTLK